jgi:hypothetical protein
MIFQHHLVRTSIAFYCNFILDMGRSPGFASTACNLCAHFRLAFASATPLNGLTSLHTRNSLAHYAKGTLSPDLMIQLQLIVGIQFQVLFHSPSGVLFTFPSRYFPLSVTDSYLALPRGRGRFRRHFSGAAVLGWYLITLSCLCLRGFHLLWLRLPTRFGFT